MISVSSLSGTATDNAGGAGLASGTVQIQRASDSLFWNGTTWAALGAGSNLATNLSGPLCRFDIPDPTQDTARIRRAFPTATAPRLTRFPHRVGAARVGKRFPPSPAPDPCGTLLPPPPASHEASLSAALAPPLPLVCGSVAPGCCRTYWPAVGRRCRIRAETRRSSVKTGRLIPSRISFEMLSMSAGAPSKKCVIVTATEVAM